MCVFVCTCSCMRAWIRMGLDKIRACGAVKENVAESRHPLVVGLYFVNCLSRKSSCLTIPCRAVPYHAVPYRTVPSYLAGSVGTCAGGGMQQPVPRQGRWPSPLHPDGAPAPARPGQRERRRGTGCTSSSQSQGAGFPTDSRRSFVMSFSSKRRSRRAFLGAPFGEKGLSQSFLRARKA